MKISIITVCFNAEKSIEKTIKSVQAQSYNSIEHVFIDGASTDNTKKIIKKYLRKQDKFISEKDKGIYDAMNKGIEIASGEVIFFLNSGDLFYNNEVISKIVEEFNKDNCELLLGDVQVVSSTYEDLYVKSHKNLSFEYFFNDSICHQGIFYKIQKKEEFPLFDLNFPICADFDHFLKLYLNKKIKTRYVKTFITLYPLNGFSSRNDSEFIKKITCELDKIRSTHLGLRYKIKKIRVKLKIRTRIKNLINKILILTKFLFESARIMFYFIIDKSRDNKNIWPEEDSNLFVPKVFHKFLNLNTKDNTGKSDVTVLYTIRNRNPLRVLLSINSLRYNSSIKFSALIVDYGSNDIYKKKLVEICKENKMDLICVNSEGLPWNKSIALNIGLKNIKTKYTVQTDIDMVFTDDILKTCLDLYSSKTKIHCRPLWLNKKGDIKKAIIGDFGQVGGFQFMETKDYIISGGFNEEFEYWGLEDTEFFNHLKQLGYKDIWIDDKHKMYHLWHENLFGVFDTKPATAWFNSSTVFLNSVVGNRKTSNIADRNYILNRPILEFIEKKLNNPKIITIENYLNDIKLILKEKESSKFIRLKFQSRFQNPSIFKHSTSIKRLNSFFDFFSLELSPKKNQNFDLFYTSIPVLIKEGLIDYYLSGDMEEVYLLFN